MPDISPAIPVAGQPNSTEEPKIVTALTQLVAAVNDVDAAQLLPALADSLGVNSGATTRRGFAQVATSETTTSLTSVDLATPGPSVTLVVPANGLVIAAVQADITNSVGGGTSSQVTLMVDGAASNLTLTGSNVSAQTRSASVLGLVTGASSFPFVAAGSHTFKLQYNVSGASTGTFANRKLWVAAFSFS